MANFIQKFTDAREYENAEHQYPNISLVEGEGLIWTAEEPARATILFNGSEIKWTLDDRSDWDYAKYGELDIDLEALNDFYVALANPKDYSISTSNVWFEWNGTRYDATVEVKSGDAKSDNFEFNIILSVATRSAVPQLYYTFVLSDYSQTAGHYNNVVINEKNGQIAHWGLNYTIGEPPSE